MGQIVTSGIYIKSALAGILAAFLLMCFVPAPALAQSTCIAGLPCVLPTVKNTNNFDDIIPQNISPAPNAHKIIGNSNISKKVRGQNSCDANFMNQIYAKAYLQAQRESQTIQAVLRKPDSVLQYSCFDLFVSGITSKQLDVFPGIHKLFSETEIWSASRNGKRAEVNLSGPKITAQIDNKDVDPVQLEVYMEYTGDDEEQDSRLAGDLEALVIKSLNEYTDKNFPYDLLNNGLTVVKNEVKSEAASQLGIYYCDVMNSIWDYAHCDDYQATDKVNSMLSNFVDPRIFPERCHFADVQAAELLNTAYLGVAENRNPVTNKDFFYVDFDKATTRLSDFMRADKCKAPVPTGVTVSITRQSLDISGMLSKPKEETYNEKVCVTPSCYYDYKQGICVKEP